MAGVIEAVAETTGRNIPWMAWNLFLAMVPLALAVLLFRGRRHRGAAWWAGVAAFLAFLPNAPYVLTDVLHLVGDVQRSSDAVIVFGLLPQYGLFFLAGFGAYVAALVALERYLVRAGLRRHVLPAMVAIHGLSAVGVYLGRFLRFNSWDLLVAPNSIADAVTDSFGRSFPFAVTVFTFAVLAAGHIVFRELGLALAGRYAHARHEDGM
jgi:uncharacterized membrane protein